MREPAQGAAYIAADRVRTRKDCVLAAADDHGIALHQHSLDTCASQTLAAPDASRRLPARDASRRDEQP